MARTRVDTSGLLGFEVVVDGLEQVRNGLEEVSPKLRRNLDRELKEVVGAVAVAASRQVRSRTGTTAAGYKVTARSGRFKIVNRTRGGAILEFAAVPHCPQGASLVATLNEEYGKPGRILWDSWDTMAPYVTERITHVVDDARIELDRVMG